MIHELPVARQGEVRQGVGTGHRRVELLDRLLPLGPHENANRTQGPLTFAIRLGKRSVLPLLLGQAQAIFSFREQLAGLGQSVALGRELVVDLFYLFQFIESQVKRPLGGLLPASTGLILEAQGRSCCRP